MFIKNIINKIYTYTYIRLVSFHKKMFYNFFFGFDIFPKFNIIVLYVSLCDIMHDIYTIYNYKLLYLIYLLIKIILKYLF